MDGTVKWFNPEKGFGFILVTGRPNDLFFHISEYRSDQTIQTGDKVRFDIGMGKQNKEVAKNVYFVAPGGYGYENRKPYYGKPTCKKEFGPKNPGTTFLGGVLGGALFGPVGALIGGILGSGGMEHSAGKEITSPCLRCGGTGNVTNIDENFIGFQCANCKAFWKKRNKERLSMSNVIR